MTVDTWLAGVLALACGGPVILLARAITSRAGLVDRPDARKQHVGDVPLAGGIGVYLTVAVVAGFAVADGSMALWPLPSAILTLSLATLALGVTDDYRDLSARLRLAFQAIVALLLVLVFDIRITGLGDVLGVGSIGFEPFGSVLFTVFCVVGVLNATNMLDGVDGLLAAIAAVTFAAVAALALASGTSTLPTLCLIFIGALGAFLAFNLGLFGERRRVFLGDSGSTMLGLVLAAVLIAYTQSPGYPLHPVAAGWLLGLPLLDSSVVLARRLRERRSPFAAGRDHLHHRLLNLGCSPARTLVVMVALQLLMVGIGVSVQFSGVPPYVYFYGFVALVVAGFVADVGLPDAPFARRASRAAAAAAAAERAALSAASRSTAAGSPALAPGATPGVAPEAAPEAAPGPVPGAAPESPAKGDRPSRAPRATPMPGPPAASAASAHGGGRRGDDRSSTERESRTADASVDA